MADIKNYGIIGVGADVQFAKNGGRIVYDAGLGRFNITQADGTTLQNIRVGTIEDGTWNGTIIGATYGGTGQDFSAASGIVKFTAGVASVGDVDLAADVTGTLPIANGGTGATTAAGARTSLGLGTIATQDANNVAVTGGTLDGVTIGGTTAGAVTFTDLSDGTITITGFVDEDNMTSDSATLIPTQQSVKAYVDNSLSISGSSMNVAGDTGAGSIVFETETLTINGTTNEIDVVFDTVDTFTVGLPNDVTIANDLTVTGAVLTDTINTTDLTVSGNLSVAGNVFTVESEIVTVVDAVLRVNSDGAVVDSGIEANINGTIRQFVWDVDDTAWSTQGDDLNAGNLETAGAVTFGTLNDGSIGITGFVDEDNMTSDSATLVPTQQSVKAYVDAQITAQDLDFQADTGGELSVDLDSQIFTISGGTNISTSGSGQSVTVNLNNSISVTNVTASGTVSFGNLTDTGEGITISKFVDEADGIGNNDNDTSIPTSAAVIDYVENNGGDGLILRNTFTANSTDSTFAIGTVPNVTNRTYYADKIVIKVGTSFAGGSFDHIVVRDNNGTGITVLTEADADATIAGTYVVQLDGDQVLTKNATVDVLFFQTDGTTASVVTSGSMTATVHYNWV